LCISKDLKSLIRITLSLAAVALASVALARSVSSLSSLSFKIFFLNCSKTSNNESLFNELILDIAAIFLRRLSGESGELLLLLLFLLYGRLPLDELDFGLLFGLFLAARGDNVGLLFWAISGCLWR
jgi:hypothetical protein